MIVAAVIIVTVVLAVLLYRDALAAHREEWRAMADPSERPDE